MVKLKITCVALWSIILATAFVNSVYPQGLGFDVHITPEEANIDIGEGIKLDAFAFSLNSTSNTPVGIDAIFYEVHPDSLGSITEDGFFVARRPGVAKIKVTVHIGNRTLTKEVCVRIGKFPRPFFDVKVIPQKVVVPTGSEQQFEVAVSTAANVRVRPLHVLWEVRPADLGKIDSNGLFVAGEHEGRGKVVAVVEVDGLRLSASAQVIVSPPATGAISGSITKDNGGAAISGAVIKAIRLGKIRWIQRTESDDEGNYLVGNLIPGNYVLYANARGFIGEFYDNTRDYLQAFVLTVANDDTLTDKDFGLSEGATIAGKVTDESGNPLGGAHVSTALKIKPEFAKHTTTQSDGSYEIGELPTGGYVARAKAFGYQIEFFDDKAGFNSANIINIQEPDRIDTVNFDLGLASAISGVVKDGITEEPVAGAHVQVFPSFVVADIPHRTFRETRTNENGEYLLELPPGEDYRVVAHHEEYVSQWYDGKSNFAEADPVQVKQESHTTNIDFNLLKRGSIFGKVIDPSTTEPLAGAIVQAFPELNAIHIAEPLRFGGLRAKTNEDGDYVLEGLLPDVSYIVMASAEHYLPEFWQEADNKADATPIKVGAGEAKGPIDFTLLLGGSISGTVASVVDSLPIPRALVNVFEINSHNHRRGYTDENGDYKVGGLASGSYFVQVIADGFFHQFYKEARNRADADTIMVVAPNETTDKDLYLHPIENRRGTIAGRVVAADDEHTPIFGAVVIAVSPKRRFPHVTFSGPNGHYKITDLPAGRYYLFAWARGFVGEFFRDAKNFKNADPVAVESGQVVDGINFDLIPRRRTGAYTVRGKIRSQISNGPLQGILVRALSVDGELEVTAVTDAHGSYTLLDMPAGAYKVEASGAGYQDGFFGGVDEQTAATISVGAGQDAQGADIDLGLDTVTSIESGNGNVPEQYSLFQNYPNPFNPETQIKYQLSRSSKVTLKVFNLLGQEVVTLINEEQPAGIYTIRWDGKDKSGRLAASGVYIFQMKAGNEFVTSRRMLLLK